jgi:hypothetical protein
MTPARAQDLGPISERVAGQHGEHGDNNRGVSDPGGAPRPNATPAPAMTSAATIS